MQLQVVLAHELGHLKCEHGLWITALNVLSIGVRQAGLLGPLISPVIDALLLEWLRAAEYTCDRAAILVAQDWKVAANAMLKISVGNAKIYGSSPNIDAFLEQADRLKEESQSPSGAMISDRLEQQATHPLPVARVKMMKEWGQSAQYKGILARGEQQPSLVAS